MIAAILFILILSTYAVFSYSLVDPNLVLSSNDTFWNFQQWMWQNILPDSKMVAYGFMAIVILLFILYFQLLRNFKKIKQIPRLFEPKYLFGFLIIITSLLISYNALSHDIFNYVFNAKMVVEYGADPHVVTALDFPNDPWVRFMHNTHTTAPYGKGWTYLSIFPFMMGLGKLTLTLFSFKILSLLSIVFLYLSMQLFSQTLRKRYMNLFELGIIFLNPLLLIEVLSNYHNDIWMMSLAMFGLSLLLWPIAKIVSDKKKKVGILLISIGIFLLSISIKFATLTLLPIWLFILFLSVFSCRFSKKIGEKFKSKFPQKIFERLFSAIFSKVFLFLPDVAALLMMLPLFTSRSQQFLPWYILWVLVWVPFMNFKTFRNLIVVFTISSSLRYLPWMFNNFQYGDEVLRNGKLITWGLPALYLFTNLRKKLGFNK